MAKNLTDFAQKLKGLCQDHEVFIKGVTIHRDHANGRKFVDYSLSARDDNGELNDGDPQVIHEITKFA